MNTVEPGCLGSLVVMALVSCLFLAIPRDNISPDANGHLIVTSIILEIALGLLSGIAIMWLCLKYFVKDRNQRSAVMASCLSFFVVLVHGYQFPQYATAPQPDYSAIALPETVIEKIELGDRITNNFFGETDLTLKVTWSDGETDFYAGLLPNGGGSEVMAIYYLPPSSPEEHRRIILANNFERVALDLDSRTLNMNPGDKGDDEAGKLDRAKPPTPFIGTYQQGYFYKSSVVDDPGVYR